MIHQLYKITNKLNGKYYIGVHTGDIFKDNYWGSGYVLKESIEKSGKENFDREIIKQLNNKKEIYKLETQIVNEDFVNNQQTYNLAIGGIGGNNGKIVNKKISDAMKGEKNIWYGKKRPDHSKWLKENHPFKGKKHKTSTIQKMRDNTPVKKKVLQYTKEGELIKEWDSAANAIRSVGVQIYSALHGYNQTAAGFVWKYKNEA